MLKYEQTKRLAMAFMASEEPEIYWKTIGVPSSSKKTNEQQSALD